MSEILAPAGDEEAFYAAVHSGADAVYLGLKDFSARGSAVNFSPESLKKCAAYAHVLGVRVYIALNTLVKEGELDSFFRRARQAWDAGADALIVQDLFLGKRLKEAYPEMVLHLSTQAGVCNVYGARLAKRCGFSRVILARETPIEGIAAVAREIETEVFVQGALCTCFSGRCYFSAFVGGNSGNRGFCKQPCRKKYKIDRAGFDSYAYRLSLADLQVGKDIRKLAEAGVFSFKIEGRMRSPAYVGAAVRFYRDILDGSGDGARDLSDLRRTYNRGDYTKGYLFGQDERLISASIQGHKGEMVGRIAEGKKKIPRFVFVRSSYVPTEGDGFKIVRGDREAGGCVYTASCPVGEGGFYLPAAPFLREGDGVYLTTDVSLAARVASRRRTLPLSVHVTVSEGERPRAVVRGAFGEYAAEASFVAGPAKTRALTKEEAEDCFSKTDVLPFSVRVTAAVEGKPFAVRSALNAFRREVYEGLYARLAGERQPLCARGIGEGKDLPAPPFHSAAIADASAFSAMRDMRSDCFVYAPHDYKDLAASDRFLNYAEYSAGHIFLYLPAFMTDADIAAALPMIERFDGVFGEGAWTAEFCREFGKKLFAGTGFNLFNSVSLRALAEESALVAAALSKELSARESAAFQNAFLFAGGAIELMELGHCPFGKTCARCDRRASYTLTDEQGRAFPLRRYESAGCRFTLFNCVPLAPREASLALYDFRALSEEDIRAYARGGRPARVTAGLSVSGVR